MAKCLSRGWRRAPAKRQTIGRLCQGGRSLADNVPGQAEFLGDPDDHVGHVDFPPSLTVPGPLEKA